MSSCGRCVNGVCQGDGTCQCTGYWLGPTCEDESAINSAWHYVAVILHCSASYGTFAYCVYQMRQSWLRMRARKVRPTLNRYRVLLLYAAISQALAPTRGLINWEGDVSLLSPTLALAVQLVTLVLSSLMVTMFWQMGYIWQQGVRTSNGGSSSSSRPCRSGFAVIQAAFLSLSAVLCIMVLIDMPGTRSLQAIFWTVLGPVQVLGIAVTLSTYSNLLLRVLHRFPMQNIDMIWRIRRFMRNYIAVSVWLVIWGSVFVIPLVTPQETAWYFIFYNGYVSATYLYTWAALDYLFRRRGTATLVWTLPRRRRITSVPAKPGWDTEVEPNSLEAAAVAAMKIPRPSASKPIILAAGFEDATDDIDDDHDDDAARKGDNNSPGDDHDSDEASEIDRDEPKLMQLPPLPGEPMTTTLPL